MYEIYGTTNCEYCDLAKKLLTVYDKEYTFIDVAERGDVTAAFFEKFPEVSSVPQIIEDNYHIGGYNELKTWLNHTE